MKKLIFPIAIGATMLLSAFTVYTATNWTIASGYSIKFTSDDPSGAFTSLKGDISFNEKDLASSKFNVTIDASSINTGNGMKNSKAKGSSYFDVDKYPAIKYTSSKINKTANGYEAVGTLDMHGVQKPLTIPFTFSNNTFTGSFSINRLDWGVGTAGHAESVLKVDVSVPVTK